MSKIKLIKNPMKNKFSLLILITGIFLIVFYLESPLLAEGAVKYYGTQGVCTKPYYKPTDIVGYFYDVKLKEALYITYDWCVVKPLLWYGTIFGHYDVDANKIKDSLDNIFPEKQVYYGLIPNYFFKDGGNFIQRGKFTTQRHGDEKTGYFLNDNAFKNIFAGNFPKPPRYVPTKDTNDPIFQQYGLAGVKEAKGTVAPLIMNRMLELHQIFENHIAKGRCNNISYAQKYTAYCDYFAIRTKPYSPRQYYGLDKLPEYKPQ